MPKSICFRLRGGADDDFRLGIQKATESINNCLKNVKKKVMLLLSLFCCVVFCVVLFCFGLFNLFCFCCVVFCFVLFCFDLFLFAMVWFGLFWIDNFKLFEKCQEKGDLFVLFCFGLFFFVLVRFVLAALKCLKNVKKKVKSVFVFFCCFV